MSKVFVSYPSGDSQFAHRMATDLEQRGHDVWLGDRDVGGGAAWGAEVSQAIRSCQAFLLLLSEQAIQAPNVVRELSIADEHRRPIIPVMHEPCRIPPEMQYQLAGLRTVDACEIPYAQTLEQLDTRLRSLPKSEEQGSKGPVFDTPVRKLSSLTGTAPASQVTRMHILAPMSVAAGVLGFNGLPVIGFILAVVLGRKARKAIRSEPGRYTGERLARIGVIIGWVGIVLSLLAGLYLLFAFSEEYGPY